MLMKPVYSPEPTATVHKQVNLVCLCLLLSIPHGYKLYLFFDKEIVDELLND